MQHLSPHLVSREAAKSFFAASGPVSRALRSRSRPRRIMPYLRRQASLHFPGILASAAADLRNRQKAITCIDLPTWDFASPAEDWLWSLALAMTLSSLVIDPLRTPSDSSVSTLNHLRSFQASRLRLVEAEPAAAVLSSYQNSSIFQLQPALLYLPEHVTQFSLPSQDEALCPRATQNLHWQPLALWKEREYFYRRLAKASSTLQYQTSAGRGPEVLLEAPLYPRASPWSTPLLNPHVRPDEGEMGRYLVALEESLKTGLEAYQIELRPRRLIVYRNTLGFYRRASREIGWGAPAGRLLSFDKNGIMVPFRLREEVLLRKA